MVLLYIESSNWKDNNKKIENGMENYLTMWIQVTKTPPALNFSTFMWWEMQTDLLHLWSSEVWGYTVLLVPTLRSQRKLSRAQDSELALRISTMEACTGFALCPGFGSGSCLVTFNSEQSFKVGSTTAHWNLKFGREGDSDTQFLFQTHRINFLLT